MFYAVIDNAFKQLIDWLKINLEQVGSLLALQSFIAMQN